jgi:polyisoprenoid-binding protein YceI
MTHPRLLGRAAVALLVGWPATSPGQSPAVLASEQFAVDPQHSTVGFTSRILGVVKVRGRFRKYDVAVTYDAAHPERSSVTAIIQAKSIDTDMDFRDNHLRSPDFFDAGKFTTIEFQSDRVVARPGGLAISGPLTMHGVTRPITFPAQVTVLPQVGSTGGVSLELEADLRLSRADFGIVGTNAFNPSYNPATTLLSDSVDVYLELEADHPGYLDRPLGDLGATISHRPPPGVVDTVARTLEAHGVGAAIDLYRTLRATRPAAFDFGTAQLDVLGHVLTAHGRLKEALAMFSLNAQVYPSSADVLESLAEAQALAGDAVGSLASYRRAAGAEPLSATAKEMIRRLVAAGF